jgi:phosphotransacetylase
MNDKIYPSMVIRSQAEAIELLEKENADLKQRLNVVNEMNVANYNKYCEELKENTKLKSVLKEIRELLLNFNNGICVIDGKEKPAFTKALDFDKTRELLWNLLQILDKYQEGKHE